jgi:glyoxylase-like metal-dependent hydrolase (beta-lactamase superfamily II)
MIEMFSKVWPAMPQRVINTHEDADHVWGNQLFHGAEIIAHRSVPERMKHVADPKESQKLLHGVGRFLTRILLKATHPGIAAAGQQLLEDYNFDGIELVLPTTLFDERYELNLDGTEVHLIHVGPCHQVGDTIIHVPKEGVVFAGDVLFRQCTPMGWTGSYDKWFTCLDLMIQLNPKVIVPGHGTLCGVEGAIEMTLGLCFAAAIAGLFAAFPTAIIGAMMFLVGIELTKFVRDVRPGRDLIPLVLTIAVSLLANMAVGFIAGLVVHYGMERWWGKAL